MFYPVRPKRNQQRGATLVEFSIAAFVFIVALFGVLEVARLAWTYNALGEAVRMGARYASINAINSQTAIKNVVVYGAATPANNAQPVVYGLTTSQVSVTYASGFGVGLKTVTVTLSNYQFRFLTLPNLFGSTITFPAFQIATTGESAGCVPELNSNGCT